jgi:uncharacterized repeat protein (TIGR03803 family)
LAGLNLSGNALYGTTYSGGAWGNGTVFSLTFRPQLSIIPYGTYVIVTWPTNVAGFNYSGYSLQSATNLNGPINSLDNHSSTTHRYRRPECNCASCVWDAEVLSAARIKELPVQTFLNNLFLPILWLLICSWHRRLCCRLRHLHGIYFQRGSPNSLGFYTNSAGAYPFAELILSGQTLYGTAGGGGPLANGTVFAINADGTRFRNLYSFSPSSANSSGVYTNDDGLAPSCSLVLSGNTLYGTAWAVALGAMARSSNSTSMARRLKKSMFSPPLTIPPLQTLMELDQMQD